VAATYLTPERQNTAVITSASRAGELEGKGFEVNSL